MRQSGSYIMVLSPKFVRQVLSGRINSTLNWDEGRQVRAAAAAKRSRTGIGRAEIKDMPAGQGQAGGGQQGTIDGRGKKSG